MDEQQFLAAAARHDAQVMAATVGGQVISDPQRFLDMLREAEARRAVLDADTRTVEQIAGEVGQLYQRFLDAWWYGSTEQTQQAADAFARAMEHPAAGRLYVHAPAVRVGDYIRAVGLDPDGARDAATGVVDEVNYTERDRRYGFAFTLLPVVRADRYPLPVDIWVPETGSPNVLRLPTPTDRGRQPWLDATADPTADEVDAAAAVRGNAPAAHPAALAKAFDSPAAHAPTGTTPATGVARPGRARPATPPPDRAPGSARR